MGTPAWVLWTDKRTVTSVPVVNAGVSPDWLSRQVWGVSAEDQDDFSHHGDD